MEVVQTQTGLDILGFPTPPPFWNLRFLWSIGGWAVHQGAKVPHLTRKAFNFVPRSLTLEEVKQPIRNALSRVTWPLATNQPKSTGVSVSAFPDSSSSLHHPL